ncbi:hypothetical protein [Pseudomonas protegens]|uniref:hypothetical protein n=1 Tax=Pseudomonas protegens TaxID=380021 RepID=UPI00215F7382|nr:hypothetical protein [Pseudomonas protegens]
MNFHVKLANGRWGIGVLPQVKLQSGWRQGEELFVKTPTGWRTVWRRQVVYVNTESRAGASIFDLMGRPTKRSHYVFINRALLYGGASSFALRTGTFPAGSRLTIINESYIRGAGGAGGGHTTGLDGKPGGAALLLDFPVSVDNSKGFIFGGGGGGGGSYAASRNAGAGGGAGRPGGGGGTSFQSSTLPFVSAQNGTDDVGGAGGGFPGYGPFGSAGGAPGKPGTAGTAPAGAAGSAVATNGFALVFTAGNDSTRVKGPIT